MAAVFRQDAVVSEATISGDVVEASMAAVAMAEATTVVDVESFPAEEEALAAVVTVFISKSEEEEAAEEAAQPNIPPPPRDFNLLFFPDNLFYCQIPPSR